MVRQGLSRDAYAGVMQLVHRNPHRLPAGGDHRGRPIQPLGELPQRADPVLAALLRQFGGPSYGDDEVEEGRLQYGGAGAFQDRGGHVAHWDWVSLDRDGWGLLVMYMLVNWEHVNSIYPPCTCTFLPNLGSILYT